MAKSLSMDEFSNFLSGTVPSIKEKIEGTIKLCCEKVRSDIQESMAKTPRDTTKTYYTNNKTKAHYPSLPGNPPAPDTSNLRNSIRYEVNNENNIIYGIVGTTQKNPDYGVFTEYGTSKMAPRPWLRPAMKRNDSWIRKSIAKAVADAMEGRS